MSLLLSNLFLSCEAPRSNPLDPENQINSALVSLEGIVQTLSVPYTPLEGVSIQWYPDKETGSIAFSDSKGTFSFNNITRTDGKLVVEKAGYFTDTVLISWGTEKKIARVINLNREPVVDSLAVFSSVVNSTSSPVEYSVGIAAKVNDADNDIDTLYVENEVLKLIEPLDYDIDTKEFSSFLSIADLKVDNLEKIVGQDFSIIVKDKFGHQLSAGSKSISRVIKDYIQLITPVNNAVVDTVPVFSWQKFQAPFVFTYMLEIYTADFTRQLVKRITDISSNTTTYKYTQPLPKGNYNWVVWIVDNNKNRSMSLPGTFRVQ